VFIINPPSDSSFDLSGKYQERNKFTIHLYALKKYFFYVGLSVFLTGSIYARHTFAKTVALKNGSSGDGANDLGHAKITTTQIYADVDEEKIVDDMSTIEEKLNAKRKIVQEKYALKSIFNI
jgi:hypothetical protein